MKIAIISDIHNNLVNLKKVLDCCASNGIEKIICCGDLASMEALNFLNDNFEGEIFYVFGNMDNDQLRNVEFSKEYKKTKIFKEFGEVEIENKKIAFVHKPDEAKKLCESGKYEFVFHGHTHKPWMEKINDCILLNPGNVAGEIFQATFAVWNTKGNSFELIRINELK
jgi:putative phosphoesterase